jgi:hypothetical protein
MRSLGTSIVIASLARGGQHSKADEYRQLPNDCIAWARIAISDDQREQFLELAKKWTQDAEMIDQGIEVRTNKAAKASEMAGREIDLLGAVGNRRRTATSQAEAY